MFLNILSNPISEVCLSVSYLLRNFSLRFLIDASFIKKTCILNTKTKRLGNNTLGTSIVLESVNVSPVAGV